MTVTIAIPSRGVVSPTFAVALRRLHIPCQYEVLSVEGADVAVARNVLIDAATCDYVFFLDDDVIPEPDTLDKLLARQKDVVSGLYFAKQPPHYPQLFKKTPGAPGRFDSIADYEKDKLFEVDASGGGCILIKRDVFQKLKKPYFKFEPATEKKPRKGEDLYFCEKLADAGITMWADTSAYCLHMGMRPVGAEFWEASKQKIEELKKQLGPERFEELKKLNHEKP